MWAKLLLTAAYGGLGITQLLAQGTTAAILGTVTDSTGATIAGASLQVTNVGTGQSQTAITDSAGRYNVPTLSVGNYEVQASKEGFAKVIRRGVTLTVGSQNVVDFSLAVGQAQQTVTVEGRRRRSRPLIPPWERSSTSGRCGNYR